MQFSSRVRHLHEVLLLVAAVGQASADDAGRLDAPKLGLHDGGHVHRPQMLVHCVLQAHHNKVGRQLCCRQACTGALTLLPQQFQGRCADKLSLRYLSSESSAGSGLTGVFSALCLLHSSSRLLLAVFAAGRLPDEIIDLTEPYKPSVWMC